MMNIPPCKPVFDKEMEDAAINALRNERFIFGESMYKFEEEFAKYCNVKHALSVSSGTNAITIALLAAGLKNNDEIITSSSSYIATSNAVIHANGIPKFCDINDSYTIEVNQIEKKINDKTRGIIPVHLYGYPADIYEINTIAKKHGLYVIEDAAQAHGALYKNKKTGSLADIGCFSFYTTKNMTVCGDGGMITTNDDKIAETVNMIRNHGQKEKDVHEIIGFTSRLNTVNAAIGRIQLKRLPMWVEQRRAVAKRYDKLLSDVSEVMLPPSDTKDKKPSYHLYEIKTKKRDELLNYLKVNGIICLIHYPTPIHLQPYYKKLYNYKKGDFPKSEELSNQAMDLPMFQDLKDDEIHYVSEKIHDFFK